MKRIFIILAVALASLISMEAQAQTKVFKNYMENWNHNRNYHEGNGKWEITQFSGDVLRRLMPQAASDKTGAISKISSIFQIIMDDNNKRQFARAEGFFIAERNYTNILSITLNGTTYKIFKARLKQQTEYAILINNDKSYCICDIVGYLNDEQILSFIGMKNNGDKITGDKKDSVEVIQP